MEKLTKQLKEQFLVMCKTGKLYKSAVNGDYLWNLYLTSFEKDPVFRDPESSEHNCNHCKNFIRRYANVVAIDDDNNIITMFDILPEEKEYIPSVQAMAKVLKENVIKNIFVETFSELNSLPYESCKSSQTIFKLGVEKNFKQYNEEEANKYGVVEVGKVYTFNHMMVELPKQFVDGSGSSYEYIASIERTSKELLQRALIEIPLDTLFLVRDLINQNSLLDGTTHLQKVEAMILAKKDFEKVPNEKKDNWLWKYSSTFKFSRFKNELIGVLCTELAEGKELNDACKSWNIRVDPVNYMKAVAPITKKQIELAKKFVEESGYTDSFDRRMARIEDIKVDEILHSNIGDGSIKGVSIFDGIKSPSTRHKRSEFDKVEEVSIDKFMTDILPNCTSIEAFLENRMEGNMVTITNSNNINSKPIFKWSNNYSWTYNGNLAGKSMIKENVKAVGGKITGILRCSLQWNDEDTKGIVDFDLHCKTPYDEIYYSNKKCHTSKGWLDVDMISPSSIGIENITWQQSLKDGEYSFHVKNFNGGNNKGFKVEIEFDGNVYNYYYANSTSYKQIIKVATIIVKNGIMEIKHHLPESSNSKDIYNLETNQFHKVNLVCLSPNYWGENNVGNKHYFFMIENCKSPVSIRSFHNENLIPQLVEHRKVLDILGNTTQVESIEKQLSGLGFNSTVKDELIVRVTGSFKRVLKIKFA